MREREQAFRDKRATLAAIGLGDRHYARVFREETGITFPLLIDEERRAYMNTEEFRNKFSAREQQMLSHLAEITPQPQP